MPVRKPHEQPRRGIGELREGNTVDGHDLLAVPGYLRARPPPAEHGNDGETAVGEVQREHRAGDPDLRRVQSRLLARLAQRGAYVVGVSGSGGATGEAHLVRVVPQRSGTSQEEQVRAPGAGAEEHQDGGAPRTRGCGARVPCQLRRDLALRSPDQAGQPGRQAVVRCVGPVVSHGRQA